MDHLQSHVIRNITGLNIVLDDDNVSSMKCFNNSLI